MQAWSMGVKLTPSRRYRFSPHLVNFNMTKVLSTILELDRMGVRWARRSISMADFRSPFLWDGARRFYGGDEDCKFERARERDR
jgi:hypothetical protein